MQIPKLRVKMKYNTEIWDWTGVKTYIIETYFPDIFCWYESTFYLDNPALERWVKSKENYIHAKIKRIKLGHGLQLAQKEKHHCICTNKIWISKNNLKVLEEAFEEIKELRDISRDVLFL